MQQPPPSSGGALPRRVVLHLDLDCFYCQVEQLRLGIPEATPLAVQQWQGLIAVNYAARAAGITRHMRAAEAKRICPALVLVHVQTIGHMQLGTGGGAGGSAAPAAAAAAAEADGPAPQAPGARLPPSAAGSGEGTAHSRGSSKACLQRYRKASGEIMRLLSAESPGCAFEKASIDEVYVDVTPLAARDLAEAEAPGGNVALLLQRAADASVVLGEGGLQQDMAYDRLAAAGAAVAARLRALLRSRLSFTASGGIGPNKLLAKIASASFKPDKQTVVLPRAVPGLLAELPLAKVKGLGGKLGARLQELGASTAGEAAALPWETLLGAFGRQARWVHDTVRGLDDEPVEARRDKVKTINSYKSMDPTSSPAAVEGWMAVLAEELAERMAEDEAEHQRRPRTLVLQYRGGAAPAGRAAGAAERSVRVPMPVFVPRDTPSAQAMAATALALFRRISPPPWPLTRLGLVAADFVELPGSSGSGPSAAALARFLSAGKPPAAQHGQQPSAGRQPAEQQQLEPLPGLGLQQRDGQQASQAQLRDGPARPEGPPEHAPQSQLQLRESLRPQLVGQAAPSGGPPTGAAKRTGGQEGPPAPFAALAPSAGQRQNQPLPALLARAGHEPRPQQQQQQQQPGSGAAASPAPVAPPGDDAGTAALLQGVDVAEQARIMRDFELARLKRALPAGPAPPPQRRRAAPAGGKGGGGGRQLSIAAMLGAPAPSDSRRRA